VAPEEEGDIKAIERAIGKVLPRVTLPDFDYKARPQAKLEIPLAERIAAIRSRKADERARSRARGPASSRPTQRGSHGGGSRRPSGPSGGRRRP
jgi:ATP-dependent RNA helicase RhlE